MTIIATLGPVGCDSYQAARQYLPEAEMLLFNRAADIFQAFTEGRSDLALVPVYNTREGEIKEYFKFMEHVDQGFWIDNVVIPIHLSLGALQPIKDMKQFDVIVGSGSVFKQCSDYINMHFPDATLLTVPDIESAINDIKQHNLVHHGVIESEQLLKKQGLALIDREVAAYNRTRFAILGREIADWTGYDATAIITRPLKDRVGMLFDILGEFTRRGINLLDIRSENDIKTQKLQIYLESEGHVNDRQLRDALKRIETNVIQEENSLKLLGSFPRVDMRVKKIKTFGFIGSGDMSIWFADRLENEGYRTIITGRATELRPEEMIAQVDVVVVCVPISVTADTVKKYGKYLKEGQALILLAGESENTLRTAMESTDQGVEVMLVHNLWGPQAATMKDKNVAVVRTPRSGSYCSEFEAFLYKHGADIYQDSPEKHDLLVGIGQKLPTTISVALAMTLAQHHIDCRDIGSHSTLTSLYGILAMARIHNQNPRTYAEIIASRGEGQKIVKSFADNLSRLMDIADKGEISNLCELMNANRLHMPSSFLELRMKQAMAVDQILSDPGMKNEN